MSKKNQNEVAETKVAETKVAETKVAEAEVKVEKKPTEKQTMLADYKAQSAVHKAWRQKLNAAYPRLHVEAAEYLKKIDAQIAAWDKELDKLLAKPAKKAEAKKEAVAA